MRRAALAAAIWVGAASALGAQTTPAPSPSPTVGSFPVAVEQVTVDVVVANRNGDPVGGLTARDFTILEDGREQNVVSFDLVRPEGPAAGGAEAAADLSPWPV
ncbi:MAG: hypothetical protein DMF78_25285, partial [Acidobacteria bacterium]